MNTIRLVPYCLTAIGLGAAASAVHMHLWDYGEPGAGLFPFLAALLLVGTSLASARDTVPEPGPVEIPRLLVYCTALGLYSLCLEFIGFLPATFLFLTCVFACVERIGWKRSLLVSTIFASATWFLFERLLSVPLPRGFWGL